MRRIRCPRWLCLLLAFLPLQATSASDTLPQVKVAYPFNIAKFTSWPGENNEVTLCAHPATHRQALLQALDQRPLDASRKLSVRFTEEPETRCQLYYEDQSRSSLKPAVALAGTATTRSTLIVADVGRTDHPDAAIRFFARQNKLLFSINYAVIEPAPYQISSNLLHLARQP